MDKLQELVEKYISVIGKKKRFVMKKFGTKNDDYSATEQATKELISEGYKLFNINDNIILFSKQNNICHLSDKEKIDGFLVSVDFKNEDVAIVYLR